MHVSVGVETATVAPVPKHDWVVVHYQRFTVRPKLANQSVHKESAKRLTNFLRLVVVADNETDILAADLTTVLLTLAVPREVALNPQPISHPDSGVDTFDDRTIVFLNGGKVSPAHL